MTALGWTPQEGDTIHCNAANRWQVPAGRYKVRKGHGTYWHLHGITNSTVTRGIPIAHLVAAEVAGSVTVIPRDELTREKQQIHLQLHAPLTGNRRGHYRRQLNERDLALFKTTDQSDLFKVEK